MSNYQSVFSQRQDKELAHGLYSPAAGMAQTNLYSSTLPTLSGLSSSVHGLSIYPNTSRGIPTASQFVSRSTTAPTGYGGMGLGAISLGAPSPPPARGGVIPMGLTRSGFMGAPGQGMGGAKSNRPSTLSSAIGSALPIGGYGGLGRSTQSMMSPMSGYGAASLLEAAGQGFDPSEFPPILSLGGRARHDGMGMLGAAGIPTRPPFPMGPQLTKPPENAPGFQMHSEDFPALPGTSTAAPKTTTESSEAMLDAGKTTVTTIGTSSFPEPKVNLTYDPAPGANKERQGPATTTPIGPPKPITRKSSQPTTVSIPPRMVQDQFGMMGLLTFIRGAETDPNLVALALGRDLTTLGLNLNSPESLYNTFVSPWADGPCRPQDIDYNVPQEYLIHPYIRDKLANIRVNRYGEDLLFYLYYSNGGDIMQVIAANELHSRDWRYHKDEKVWITRAPGTRPVKQEQTFEEGSYFYFDVNLWRKATKEFRVEYDKLEDRPPLPSSLHVLTTGGLTAAS